MLQSAGRIALLSLAAPAVQAASGITGSGFAGSQRAGSKRSRDFVLANSSSLSLTDGDVLPLLVATDEGRELLQIKRPRTVHSEYYVKPRDLLW